MNEESVIEHLKSHFAEEDTGNFDLLDYVGAFGSPLMAIAYHKLFWPDFIIYEDMVFFSDDLDEEMRTEVDSMLGKCSSKQEIEKSFNYYEVPSQLFNQHAADTYDEEDEYLAELLCETWGAKLALDYPERGFQVQVLSAEETQSETSVLFFQT